MFAYTDIKEAPWHVVDADDKKAAGSTSSATCSSRIPYHDVPHEEVKLPPRQERAVRAARHSSDQGHVLGARRSPGSPA